MINLTSLKKLITFSLLLFFSPIFTIKSPKPEKQTEEKNPIVVHIHNHNHHNNSNNIQTNSNQNNAIATENIQDQKGNLENNPNTTIKNNNNSISSANAKSVVLNLSRDGRDPRLNNFSEFLKHNKKRFILGCIVGSYGTLLYHVKQGNIYLRKTLLWSSWHKELPLSRLREIPHEQLMAELLSVIQQRYLCTVDPVNFSVPLSTFLKELENEERNLRFYRSLYQWCNRFWIKKLFPFNIRLYRKIGVRLRRLMFLKNSFMSWVTQYKMDQNKAFKQAMYMTQKNKLLRVSKSASTT